jgi:hypothetical protein
MNGDATTAAAEARPLRLTHYLEAPPVPTALRAGQASRATLTVEDARLRDAVRALLSAIDALP